jgi:hypothetical protein
MPCEMSTTKNAGVLGLSVLSLAFVTAFTLSSGCGGSVGSGRRSGSSPPTDLSGLSGKFSLPQQDANGWSILTPSADSRLIYVSSSGSDATAQVYSPASTEVGPDPFKPSGAILPYATIDAALSQARAGYPDHVLLKRGDTWTRTSAISMKSGRSAAERAVLTYYGSATARPVVKQYGLNLGRASYSAVIGIQFTASRRNPDSADFVGFANVGSDPGFDALGGYNNSVVGGLLIEDCWFDWFAGNILQSPESGGGPVLTDVIVRRNIITNNYATGSHSQGLYSDRASVWLEENVFDHNGWYKQGLNNAQAEGQATMFNHNTYFGEARDTVFRNNLFLRASSIGNKFTSNTASGMNEVKSWNLLIDDNLYVEGEVGISLGGNDDQNNGPRWRNIHVTNNVMMHIGRAQPTRRTLGWGLDVQDWDGGLVTGNVFTAWGDSSTLLNNYAIHAAGDTNDVSYTGNVINDIYSDSALVQFLDGAIHQRVQFSGNDIRTDYAGPLLSYSLAGNAGFGNNHLSSARPQSRWFILNGVANSSLDQYRATSGDTTSTAGERSFVDPDRTIETYLASKGYPADMDGFVALLRQQSKFNWVPALGASAINTYVRAGFTAN